MVERRVIFPKGTDYERLTTLYIDRFGAEFDIGGTRLEPEDAAAIAGGDIVLTAYIANRASDIRQACLDMERIQHVRAKLAEQALSQADQ